jgi:hypothetical protein
MFKWIHNWYYGYKVCKKYGLKFTPIFSSKVNGRYYYNEEIMSSIFCEYFYEILFHELGHHVDFKLTSFHTPESLIKRLCPFLQVQCLQLEDLYYKRSLVSEAKASRYAMRALKSTDRITSNSYSMLVGRKALGSYVSSIPTAEIKDLVYKVTLADRDYKLCNTLAVNKEDVHETT